MAGIISALNNGPGSKRFGRPGGPFSDNPYWLEEDCDAALAVLAFPEYFTDPDIFNAVRSVLCAECRNPEIDRGWVQVATWLNEDPAGRALCIRAKEYENSMADRWERGGLSGGGGRPGWQVLLYRGGEHRTLCFKQYPEQQFYSDAELVSLVYTQKELTEETARRTFKAQLRSNEQAFDGAGKSESDRILIRFGGYGGRYGS